MCAQKLDKGVGVGGKEVWELCCFKSVACLDCAVLCRKYFTLICSLMMFLGFMKTCFLSSHNQSCISLGTCSRTSASACNAISAQRAARHLHACDCFTSIPCKYGQVRTLLPIGGCLEDEGYYSNKLFSDPCIR